jgi:hypothetical protein
MGYKLKTVAKREIASHSTIHQKHSCDFRPYEVVGTDSNAAVRKKMGNFEFGAMTPMKYIKWIYLPMIRPTISLPSVEVVVMTFDNPDRIPAIRELEFYKNKRYKEHIPGEKIPKGKVVGPDNLLYSPDELPISDEQVDEIDWNYLPGTMMQCLNNKKGKYRIMNDVFIECLIECLVPDKQYIFVTSDGTHIYYPGRATPLLDEITYGEGDLACIQACAQLSKRFGFNPSLMITNDWDLIFPSMLMSELYNMDIDIQTGEAYTSLDEPDDSFVYDRKRVELTKRCAIDKWTKYVAAIEILQPRLEIQAIHFLAKIHYAFLLLCAAEIDYCGGLRLFGYKESAVTQYIEDRGIRISQKSPWLDLDIDKHGRHLVFYPDKFIRYVLEPIEFEFKRNFQTKSDTDCIKAFNKEIHRLLYCVRYYMGLEEYNYRGGPPIPDYSIVLFPGAKSVSFLTENPRTKYPKYRIVEYKS